MQTIYIIEDDENIRNLLKVALAGSGYDAVGFETAEEGLAAMKVREPDLAIFDLMLPGMSGMEAIRRIRGREKTQNLPVLVLTAKDKEYDKVVGLDGGADDYMTKPFGVLELLARVRTLLRRAGQQPEEKRRGILEFGQLHIDMQTREVTVEGNAVPLTFKEYELLLYLCEHKNRVIEREELLDRLWDYTADVETRTLDMHIRTLRQKLGSAVSSYIVTVRSVGYRFLPPAQEKEEA